MSYENISNGLDSILGDDSFDFASESNIYDGYFDVENEFDGDIADEGLIFKPKSTEKLLKSVESRAKKLKSVDDCDDLLAKLKTEAKKFNECLTGMKKAAQEFQDGKIDKKELAAKLKPFTTELKNNCSILTLGKVVDNKKNVTDDEIKKVKDFIEGATKIISERKSELKHAASAAKESYYNEGCESFYELYGFLSEQYAMAVEGTEYEGTELGDIALESFTEYGDVASESILDFVNSEWQYATEGTIYEGLDLDEYDIADEGIVTGHGNRAAFSIRYSAMKNEAAEKVKSARVKFKVAKKESDLAGIKEAISEMKEARKAYESMKKKLKNMIPERHKNYVEKDAKHTNASPYANQVLQWCEDNVYKCNLLINKFEAELNKLKGSSQRSRSRSASESYGGLDAFLDELDIATESYDEFDDYDDPFEGIEDELYD